ncbi:MAG: 2-oxo acid dehydrogenase subunit E2 [Planctomycetes bacterium]|nr:2-oxo acid dehydrogenase subunit E2 [Planctomycetota bacterium]
MTIEFKLPDIGEGVAEGEIVQWLVKAGDQVAEHQSVVEVMTDKATVEIPAPAAGTVTELRAAAGDVVPVGTVIYVLEAGAAGGSTKPAAAPAPAAAAPASAPAAKPAPAAATGAVIDFRLPDIGEGVAEGEIVRWIVDVGAQVAEHESVVEVMTDKATVEIPSPAAGTITEIVASAGETVPVGDVIFRLATAGAPAAVAAPAHAMAGASSAPAPVRAAAPTASAAPVRHPDEKVLAVPSARRVARELGIDLALVPGSGRNGIVRRSDVEAFSKSGAAAAPTAAPARAAAPAVSVPAGERETRTPFRGVRRKIAEAMSRSAFTAPHFTVMEEVDVTELVALRATAKTLGAEEGVKVTYMPFIMKATALALQKFPMLNGRLDEEAQELVHFHHVDLGIAADTPNGLIVPVIRDVQAKGIMQLSAELMDLAERTKSGKVKPEELKGSTFSITNAGNIGGILATPIINFPDIAILGVHRLMKKPGVVETPHGDEIQVRQYMNFSCSVDHRLADGADGARFLVYLKRLLENPGLLAL